MDKLSIGKAGEEEALRYYLQRGYRLRDRNWRYLKAEVDLIVENDDWLVFVEVKSRANDAYGEGQEFVSRAQQKRLIKAANAYVEQKDLYKEIRFDIIAILREPKFQLSHFEEAFHP